MASKGITRADVIKVARLARLELSDEEIDRFTAQLGAVIEHVGQLDAVDTSAVPPAVHALAGRAPLRPDAVATGLTHEEALANAPAAEDGAFAVPRILGSGRAER